MPRIRVWKVFAAISLGFFVSYLVPFVSALPLVPSPKYAHWVFYMHEENGAFWSTLHARYWAGEWVVSSPYNNPDAALRPPKTQRNRLLASHDDQEVSERIRLASPPSWTKIELVILRSTEEDARYNIRDRLFADAEFRYGGLYYGYCHGWPMRAWASHLVAGGGQPGNVGSIRLFNRRWSTSPLVLGVIVNTLVFAAPVYLLLTCLGALKRRRRCKHGRCIKCNYDLAGLDTCPECGRPAPSPRRGEGAREAGG